MKTGSPPRVVLFLIFAAVAVVGFFLYRAKSLQAASQIRRQPLTGLWLSENIKVQPPYLSTLTPEDSADLRQKGETGLLTKAEQQKLCVALVREAAKQLREGGVPFVPAVKLEEDGYAPPPSEEEKAAGRLVVDPHLLYLKGAYVLRVRLVVGQSLNPPKDQLYFSNSRVITLWSVEPQQEFTTTSAAAVIPGLKSETRQAVREFIDDYRRQNELPPLPNRNRQRYLGRTDSILFTPMSAHFAAPAAPAPNAVTPKESKK